MFSTWCKRRQDQDVYDDPRVTSRKTPCNTWATWNPPGSCLTSETPGLGAQVVHQMAAVKEADSEFAYLTILPEPSQPSVQPYLGFFFFLINQERLIAHADKRLYCLAGGHVSFFFKSLREDAVCFHTFFLTCNFFHKFMTFSWIFWLFCPPNFDST